jgi:hypothetical protein
MAEDKIKIFEERLTRLEAALAQRPAGPGGFTPPGGVVSDPAPYPYGYHPRYPWPPHIVSDPAPWPPHFVSDPAPWPPGTVSDPGPMPGNVFQNQGIAARALGRIGQVGDPAPPDFSRLSASQLEMTLHSINAEKARLDSMGSLIQRHLDRANLAEKKG